MTAMPAHEYLALLAAPYHLARREQLAEAEHQAELASIRRRVELLEARRALDPPTVELPALTVDGPDHPTGPGTGKHAALAPADVVRMASDLRTEADQAGPSSWSTPSAKELRRRFGIGHDKAVAVLKELDRTAGDRT